MAIGRWKSVCINVTDLETAYTFWSEVLGWEIVRDAEWHGWLGYLDDPDSDNYMILNNTTTAPVALTPPSHHEANRAHIDIYPNKMLKGGFFRLPDVALHDIGAADEQ